jgi:nucleotide-binding universal stress UspA family protein
MMSPKIIVSYDGTENDQDALALGRFFRSLGAELSLAYVRHTRESEHRREELAHDEAERLLEGGASWLGDPNIKRHVVLSASTPEGLAQLARQEGADVLVFGSDYHTAPGHVAQGNSAARLLDGGQTAVAIAPAGLHAHPDLQISTVVAADDEGDRSAHETALTIAEQTGAQTAELGASADLLVIGSRSGTPHGRVSVSASLAYEIEVARCPVLVLSRGVAVEFAPVLVAA